MSSNGLWPAFWLRNRATQEVDMPPEDFSDYRKGSSVLVNGSWLHEDDMTDEQYAYYFPGWTRDAQR